jgi:RNA polymerase sigma-70 factor, ECF subfamily
VAPDASTASALAADEARQLEALRAGDESAFTALVEEHGRMMLSLARMFVRDRSVAEEVVH